MKNKINKKIIIISLFIFLVFIYILLNFSVYKLNNLKNYVNQPIIFNNNEYEKNEITTEEIESNAKVNISDANGADIIVYSYKLDINNIPSNIFSISIDLNETINKNTKFNLNIISHNESVSYTIADDLDPNDEKILLLINENNIEKITIDGSFEKHPSSTNINEEVISIDNIDINNEEDIHYAKTYSLKFSTIVILILVSIIVVMYWFKKISFDKKILTLFKNLDISKVFLIIGIIFGITFSVLFPLFQIPDEAAHINYTLDEIGAEVSFEEMTNGFGDTSRIIRNYDEKVDIDKYFNLNQDLKEFKLSVPSVKILRHFPQAIGLLVGKLLKLPVIVVITLCELLAVLFYVFIGYKSLKLMPFKKSIIMFIMLLPICVQQMGSFSYDVVLIAMSFLFISYIMHLKFTKKEINLLDIIKLCGILFVISICKIPYVLLGLLIFLLPLPKLNIKLFKLKIDEKFIKKYWKIFIPIIVVFLGLFVFLYLSKISYGKILLACFVKPISSIMMILRSIKYNVSDYIWTIAGRFGWMDTNASIYFVIFICLMSILFLFINFKRKNNELEIEKNKFKKWEVVYLEILFLVLFSVIVLSMFEWTLMVTSIDYSKFSIMDFADFIKTNKITIGGVQGRYFIPILPLLVLPIYWNKFTLFLKKYNPIMIQIIYYIVMFIYLLILILNRYWIV